MKYVRKTFTYNGKRYEVKGKTQEEAIIKMIGKQNELKQGYHKKKKNCDEWFEEYITMYKTDASEKCIRNYRSYYKIYIHCYIGNMNLDEVTPIKCQQIINGTKGKSASLVNKVSILLKGMFEKALSNRLIMYNPAKDISLPKAEAGHRRALTEQERVTLQNVCLENGKPGLFFLVIYHCGLRPSEVTRIKGNDIDYKKSVLHVNGTKTKASARDVFIPEQLSIPHINKEEYLFQTSNGTKIGEKQIQRWWKIIKDQAEFTDLTAYCLRHDYCTRLQEADVPIDVARRLMGHSSVEMTSRIYTHSTETTLKNAAELVNSYNRK